MADETKKPKLEVVPPVTPADAADIEALWLDPSLGDGITDVHWHQIPIGKPRNFFRAHPDKKFRRKTEIYVHKREDAIEEQYYIIAPAMRGRIAEARTCVIIPCVYRDGSPRLWPLMFPRPGEKDIPAWSSARTAVRVATDKWVKLVWVGRSYLTRDALPGYAPDPDWSKLPSYNDMVNLAVGVHGIIRDTNHPIYHSWERRRPPTMAVISAATEMTTVFDWHDLPFREIWCVDTEFYAGAGLANGATYGDAMTPLCLVALEMRSGRLIRLWQDELGRFPPYRLDADALIVGYMFAAEFGFHIARGWGEPACALDAYIEFRHLVNDGAAKSEDRDKGFFGLSGALRYFCEDEIDVTRKHDTRDRILRGPPFSAQEQRDIVAYCEDDVHALARLLPHIVPTIRSLPHAMFRAKFQWAIAQQERRGVPTNLSLLTRIRNRWEGMRLDLVTELDRPFGCYEIVDGKPHWRKERFAGYARRNGMIWPRLESGALDESD